MRLMRTMLGKWVSLGFRALAALILVGFVAACSTPINLGNIVPGGNSEGDSETASVVAAPGTVAFEPIVGLPQGLALPLAQQLSTEAGARNLTIVPRETATAAVRAKGSFNAETVGQETVVTYVWDLFDANGNRKSRFGGERRVGSTATDPWTVVGDQELGAIASRTIDEILQVMGRVPVSTSAQTSQ
ncbi:MAG: hypothetical protein AAGD23_06880 [Pseudomonadota bacterium]